MGAEFVPTDVVLTCPSDKFGKVLYGTGLYRVRCRGKLCRGPEGTATYHTFRLETGEIVRTEHPEYRNPRELLGAQGA